MPHVVVLGAAPLSRIVAALDPLQHRDGAGILKTSDVFLNRAATQALVEAVVVEGGPPRAFLIHLSSREDALTVRLLPLTDPEKTPGVKRVLALVARRIRELSPGSRYGKTNLQDFLQEPAP